MKRVFIMLAIVLGSAGLLFAQKSNQKIIVQVTGTSHRTTFQSEYCTNIDSTLWELPTLRILQCGRG